MFLVVVEVPSPALVAADLHLVVCRVPCPVTQPPEGELHLPQVRRGLPRTAVRCTARHRVDRLCALSIWLGLRFGGGFLPGCPPGSG
jgi:hypothetical protein